MDQCHRQEKYTRRSFSHVTTFQRSLLFQHLILAKQVGIEKIVVFINKVDQVDNEVLELVEIEVRELLTDFGFDGINTPFISGSALLAMKGDSSPIGVPSIRKLLQVLDDYVTIPVRDYTSPFMLPIDNTFTVPGEKPSPITGKKSIIKNVMNFQVGVQLSSERCNEE
jgi:translation elongation factor EF-Tu-like GTPase